MAIPSNALLRRWNAQNAAQSAINALSSGQRTSQFSGIVPEDRNHANVSSGSDANVPNVSARSSPASGRADDAGGRGPRHPARFVSNGDGTECGDGSPDYRPPDERRKQRNRVSQDVPVFFVAPPRKSKRQCPRNAGKEGRERASEPIRHDENQHALHDRDASRRYRRSVLRGLRKGDRQGDLPRDRSGERQLIEEGAVSSGAVKDECCRQQEHAEDREGTRTVEFEADADEGEHEEPRQPSGDSLQRADEPGPVFERRLAGARHGRGSPGCVPAR